MATKKSEDTFANIAAIECLESAAATLTYKKLETGIAVFEKVAWLISRVEYMNNGLLAAVMNGNGDAILMALTVSNLLSTLGDGNLQKAQEILHGLSITRADFGTAANAILSEQPFIYDFSGLPGGGILVPPTAIYLAVQGVGTVSATTGWARIFYTTKSLTTEDYWQLVEARRIISS